MALTEQKILKQVSILPSLNAVNAQWSNQILRDGQLISEAYERKAYTQDHVQDFLAEVEGATSYLPVLGWTT